MRIIQSAAPRPLNLLAVGPNGLVAAASATFGVPSDVEVWDAATGTRRCLLEIPEHNATGAVAFTSDGRYLLGGGLGFNIPATDTNTGKVAAEIPLALGRPHFALSSDGTRLIVASSFNQHGAVECFDVGPGLVPRRLWLEGGPPYQFGWYDSPTITRDGATVAVVLSTTDGASGRPALTVSIRAAESGRTVATIPLDPAGPVRQLAFTENGSKLVVRTESRTVHLHDATTGAPAGELVHPGRPYVGAIAVHPRGPIACARTNGTVTFWDAETREQLRTLDWKAGKLVSVAFAPDGALAAAGTEDGKVVVWDVDV